MKKYVLQKLAGVLAVCSLSTLGVQITYAQAPAGTAYVSGNQLIGNQTDPWGTFFVTAGNGADKASHFKIHGPTNPLHGTIDYNAGRNLTNNYALSHSFNLRPNNDNDVVVGLGIHQNGQVQIGNTTPSYAQGDYKLAVAGKIVAQSIYVTNPSTWADFVFEPDYQPMSLPSLESYLKKNKHLPYIPSAKEVEANGYNVTEMDAKLLQTVEELTLQVIELSKQNTQMQVDIAKLQMQLQKTAVKQSISNTAR